MGHPSVIANALLAHTTPVATPPSGRVHSIELEQEQYNSHIFILEQDTLEIKMMDIQKQVIGTEPAPIRVDTKPLEYDMIIVMYRDFDEGEMDYELTMMVAEVTTWPAQTVSTSVILTHRALPMQISIIFTPSSSYQPSYSVVLMPQTPASSAEVQVMTRGHIVREQETRDKPSKTTSPFGPTISSVDREHVAREDDDVLRQLRSTQTCISNQSLLASSSRNREALTKVLAKIAINSETSPKGLVTM